MRTQVRSPAYDLIRRADLEALAAVRSVDAPIFSLYLDLRPERRTAEPPQIRFKNLLRQAEQQVRLDQQSRLYRKHWAEEAERMRSWLDAEQPLRGRGLTLLSCQPLGLWRAFQLPVPVRDQLEVTDRPYLRPLVTLLDEFESYLVVLIDASMARLIEVYLGAAVELTKLPGNVQPATGDIVEKTGHRHDTYLHRHACAAAAHAEDFWLAHGYDWLVIGGAEEALGELRNQLAKVLRTQLAGELYLPPQVELGHILACVLKIECEQERQVEAARVEALITAAQKHGPGVLGLEATLLALMEKRVQLLIVEEAFAHAGWECPNCGYLGARQEEHCPLCGTRLNEQPDIIEPALERVFEQDGELEVLRSEAARQALTQYGRIGALLRYAEHPAI